MTTVSIQHVSESFVRLDIEMGIVKEINQRFMFRVPGYQFTPKFKAGVWDGFITFLNMRNGYFPKGLVPDLIEWCEEQNYKVQLSPEFSRFKERIDFDVSSLNLPFEPHDYQLEALNLILKKKRQVILASTGAGKSLIAYMISRAMMQDDKRVLIVVPTISLVSQMAGDFDDYSVNNDFSSDVYVHQICEGAVKDTDKEIVISTWQSLQRSKPSYFEQFDCVIVDEVHTAKAASLSSILEKCTNCFYRVGLTGTLDGALSNEMTIKGHIGPVKRVTDTHELMERGVLTKIKVNGIILKYREEVASAVRGLPFQAEMDFIVKYEPRNRLIAKFACNTKGNTLVLFQYVQKHGKILHQMLKEHADKTGKTVYYVSGEVGSEVREQIRKLVEKNDNVIICASIACYQAGINIKRLHNIIFASSSKSKIRVLQSVGRGLRLHESKDFLNLYDFTDDFRKTEKSKMNFTLKHFIERMQIYSASKFPIKITHLTIG